jgi:hypothetical protein
VTKAEKIAAAATARERLLGLVQAGQTVYSVTVPTNGRGTVVRCFIARDGEVVEITSLVEDLLGKSHRAGAGVDLGPYVWSGAEKAAELMGRALFDDGASLKGATPAHA